MEERKGTNWQVTLREVFIDLLGTLVPGSLFIVAAILSIIFPIYFLVNGNGDSLFKVISSDLKGTALFIQATWIQVTFYFVFLAYFFGAIFFRQDPKKPDAVSFKKLSEGKDDIYNMENLACSSEDNCEFPYPYLADYLKKRGLNHLLPLVKWDKNLCHRTKNYVNILKIRLMQNDVLRCGTIIRNEAHVRLACSNWYVSIVLSWVCISGILIWVVGSVVHSSIEISSVIPSLIVLTVALLCKMGITNSLHYQRLREVFFILETAHVLFKDDPSKINDVFPDFGKQIK